MYYSPQNEKTKQENQFSDYWKNAPGFLPEQEATQSNNINPKSAFSLHQDAPGFLPEQEATQSNNINLKSAFLLHQDAPEYTSNDKDYRNKFRGWKTILGAISEANKLKQLRVINQELAGEQYTHEMSIALQIEVSEDEAKAIYQTFYSVLKRAKANYCWDIHVDRNDCLDWHLTFRSDHDFSKLKQSIRRAITKKHNLTGRQFEIEHQPYIDHGWLDYVGRVKKSGWINGQPVNDYYASKRTLFTKDCKLRRHGHTKTFYVLPLEEMEQIRKRRNQKYNRQANRKHFSHEQNTKIVMSILKDLGLKSLKEWKDILLAFNQDMTNRKAKQHIRDTINKELTKIRHRRKPLA
jgi:hypothetical protein